MRESGAHVPDHEVPVLAWGVHRGLTARLEIEFVVNGKRRHVDVTVKHPRATHLLRHAADRDGSAAAAGEAIKLDRYPAVPSAGLEAVLPFGIETFGRLGPSALRVLREARQRIQASDSRFNGFLGLALAQRWHARLQCALISGLFSAAVASWGFVGAAGHLWDDVADAAHRHR